MKLSHKKQKDRRIYALLAVFLFYISTLWLSAQGEDSNFVFWDNTKSYDFYKFVDGNKNNPYNEDIDKTTPIEGYGNLTGKININTAGKETLMELPGIGASLADGIQSYREENGVFQRIEEIKNVPKIGEKTFLRIKDNITVE